MKQKALIIACLLLWGSPALLAQKKQKKQETSTVKWITFNHQKVSVDFPGEPKEERPNVFVLKLADSTANFTIFSQELSARGFTEETLKEYVKSDEFWEQFKTSFLASTNGKLTRILVYLL